MKIYTDDYLRNFNFWSGARNVLDVLTYDDFEELEIVFEDLYPDGIGATELNDIFWFEQDWIAEVLGFEDWEDLENDRLEDWKDFDCEAEE